MAEVTGSASSIGPAEVYERYFVPALFGPWGDTIAGLAGLEPGHRVLDVGSGTGALARAVEARVLPGGSVTGIDASEEMLAVARRRSPDITWVAGSAESLPFADASFDAVVSQAALMFFGDKRRAVREMVRVLEPGGRLTVAVWDQLVNAPGYFALTRLLSDLFGEEVAGAMLPPFSLGDPRLLRALFFDAGLPGVRIETVTGRATYPSVEAMLEAEGACVWTLGGLLDDEQYERLRRAAPAVLGRFAQADGTVTFEVPAHVVKYGW